MNTSNSQERNTKKLKTICIRVTNDELNQIDELATYNKQSRSNYILNRCLNETTSTIYTKTFMETILSLSDLVNNLHSTDQTTNAEIILLRKEVEKIWQYLK